MAEDRYGIPRYTPGFKSEDSEGGVRRLWTNHTPLKGLDDKTPSTKIKQQEYNKRVLTNAEILNHVKHQNLNIWQSAATGATYSGGQSIIETMQGLSAGDNLFFFDFESLGTHTKKGKTRDSKAMSYYVPTEIALQKATVRADGTLDYNRNNHLSLLLNPAQRESDKLDNLLTKIEGMKVRGWKGLSADEWRSANDLILYSNEANFEKKNGVTFIKGQNRAPQAMDGGIFSTKQVKMMRKGFENLKKHGNTPDEVAGALLSYFGDTGGKFKLGGFNIKQFDIPMMMDWIENGLAKNVQDSHIRKSLHRLKNDIARAQYVDTYEAINVGYKDKATRFSTKQHGASLRQEHLATKYGIGKGTAHLGIDDVWANIQLHNVLVEKEQLLDVFKGNHAASAISYNNKTLNPGDRLFSLEGLAAYEMGKHDDIFRLDANGKFVPAYNASKQLTALSKNTEYTVEKTFQRKLKGGDEMFGILLHNADSGNYHMIARNNLEELQNVLHRKMIPVDAALGFSKDANQFSMVDRARRRWDKMFDYESGGGRYLVDKMLTLHEVNKEYYDAGLRGEELKRKVMEDDRLWNKKTNTSRVSPELYRDYNLIKDRLDAEAPHLKEFLGALDDNLPGRDGNIPASHNVALKSYSEILNRELGINESSLSSGRRMLPVQVEEGLTKNIDLTNPYTINKSLNNIVQHKTQPTKVVKNRLKEVLRLSQSSGMTPTQVSQLNQLIDNLEDGKQAWQIMEQMSQAVHDVAKANEAFGLKTVDVTDPTKVTREIGRLKDTQFRNAVFNEALNEAWVFDHKSWRPKGGGKYDLNIVDPMFKKIAESHNKSVERLFNHIGGSKVSNIGVAKAEDTLASIVGSFTRGDTKAQLLFDTKNSTLNLVLANAKVADEVFGLSPNRILYDESVSKKVAKVTIPMLDGNGNMLTRNGLDRIGRLKVFERNYGDNRFEFGTILEEIEVGLRKKSWAANRMLKDGDVTSVTSMLNAVVREHEQKYTINTKHYAPDDVFRQDTRQSKTARYARGGHIDLTQFAEDWYEWSYSRKGQQYKQSMETKREKMKRDKSLTFFQSLNKDEIRNFHMTIDDYVRNRYGLETNMHNIKDTHVMQGLRSAASADVRNLLPFGYLDPMARENIVKHGNYLELDKDDSIAQLRKAGVDEDRIERMMRRGLVTDVAQDVLKGETAFVSLRTVHLNNVEIADIMKERGLKADQLASTYDGAMIIREDVAEAFTTMRKKSVTLSEGAVLPPELQKLFENSDAFISDGNGGWMRDGKATEDVLLSNFTERDNRVGSATRGQLTVGVLAQEDVTNARGVNYLKGHKDNVYVRGVEKLDSGQYKLLLETREMMQSGVKMGSDAGDRSTAIVRSKEWFKQMGLEDAEVINAHLDAKKRMDGVYTRGVVNHAIDVVQEAVQKGQINEQHLSMATGKTFTVGSMTRDQIQEETMNIVDRIMKSSFSLGEITQITKDQITMQSTFGIDGGTVEVGVKQLDAFKSAIEEQLGVDLRKGGHTWSQHGYTLADVYNWEDQIGWVEGRKDGKVRWGYKETSMIERRANEVLGKDNIISKWLHGHMHVASTAQGADPDKYIQGIYRSVMDAVDPDVQAGRLREGDVVVTSQSDSFGKDDRAGKKTGRLREGNITEVSINAFEDIPEKLSPSDRLTVGRYQKTILSAGGVEVDINGNRVSVKDAINKNDGTFLFQLPDGFSRKNVRMIDQDLMGIGEQLFDGADDGRMPVLKRLQKEQLNLWRAVKEYNAEGGSHAHDRVQSAINNYEDALTHIASSARDGSVASLKSARMDMSGRFRTQGINPFVDGGNIAEGEVVVGKDHFKRMIAGAELDILQAVDEKNYQMAMEHKATLQKNLSKDAYGVAWRKYVESDVTNKVLDHAEREGLYGIVNRYPTIEKETMQVLKVKWSDAIKGDQGVMNIATALITNSDHDGDFFSAVLAHYKTEAGLPDGKEMHRALSAIHEQDSTLIGEVRDALVSDLREIGMKESELARLTVSDISKMDATQLPNFQAKVGRLFDIESGIARTGKADVGALDNLRYRLFDIANPVYDILEQKRGLDSATAKLRVDHLEEFGRIISQNAISSKKFTQDAILKTMATEDAWKNVTDNTLIEREMERRMKSGRYGALDDLVKGIRLGNAEGAEMIRRSNKILGLFDDTKVKDSLGASIKERQRFRLDDMLETMQYTRQLVGKEGWTQNVFGQMAVSEGAQTVETMAKILTGKAGSYFPTPSARVVEHVANSEAGKRTLGQVMDAMERGKRVYERNVLYNHDMGTGALDEVFDATAKSTFGKTAVQTDNMLSTATVAEEAGIKLRQVMGKMTGGAAVNPGAMQGAGWGAAMFGGLWAASAISRSGPTPEGLQEQTTTEQFQTANMGQPTARVAAQGTGEHINLRINAKDVQGMTQEQIAALIQAELGAMTQMQMNMNLNVNDNTQNINQQWLQGIVANAIDKGFGF